MNLGKIQAAMREKITEYEANTNSSVYSNKKKNFHNHIRFSVITKFQCQSYISRCF